MAVGLSCLGGYGCLQSARGTDGDSDPGAPAHGDGEGIENRGDSKVAGGSTGAGLVVLCVFCAVAWNGTTEQHVDRFMLGCGALGQQGTC